MKRSMAVLVAVLVAAVSALAGFGTWWFSRGAPAPPQISAYSHGHLTHAGPYLYCDVLDLDECFVTEAKGTLAVDERHPVQLSVGSVISRAPWRLLRLYDNPGDATGEMYSPGSTLAVTVPTVDSQRGPLRGLVVQLLTLVVDRDTDETFAVPHAEWAVGLQWDRDASS